LLARWRSLGNLALLPRVRELGRWLEGPAAERLGLSPRGRASIGGVLRRARAVSADVHGLWSQLLTDRALLREAFASKGRGGATDEELEELVRWVTRQAERPASADDEDDEDEERPRRARGRRHEAEALAGLSREDDGEDDDDPLHAGLGVDGRAIDEDAVAGRLDEHDDALLLRLTQLLYGGLPVAGSGKTVTHEHLIVDEAQDLSPTDIAVLRGSLTKRDSMTLAGDTAQKLIFDNGFDDWGTMLEDVGVRGVVIEPLRISYRSTRPIVEFARHVLGPLADPDPPAAPRDGVAVEQFSFGSTGECLAFLAESLRALLLRERRANVAVVTRYSAQAELYHQGLAKAEIPSLRRVHGRHFSFTPGVDIVDVSQVKGLEYDYVILAEAGASSYPDGREARHLMHIAATRAVHQLWVTSVGEPSPLLPPERW
jgi:DNA helicase-2/ATP-dependent DNA helicase PcrA